MHIAGIRPIGAVIQNQHQRQHPYQQIEKNTAAW